MARTVTLANLRTRVRELADQENNSTFIDDTELNAYINASYGRWHSMVVQADPERFETEQTINADGSAFYGLPTDYLATLIVERLETSGAYVPLYHTSVQERGQYEATTSGDALVYRVSGPTIALIPAPSSGTYRHTYVQCADTLSNDGDTVDGVNGWEDWITFDAAIKCMLKEESDAGYLIAERNKIEVEINKAAQSREFAQPRRVVDTRTRHQHGPGRRWYRSWRYGY